MSNGETGELAPSARRIVIPGELAAEISEPAPSQGGGALGSELARRRTAPR